MMNNLLLGLREAQVPLLAMLLLGGCSAKVVQVLQVGTVDAGLGPGALFPMPLRRPAAIAISAFELACGAGLVATAAGAADGALSTAVSLATSLLFIVATFTLLELRSSHPATGCGCFGELSMAPVSGRTLTRSALLAGAGLATIGLPPLQLPRSGTDAVLVLAVLAAELAVIAALSPEVSEALVRLGYSEPCELRRVPATRTLAALRNSAQWRRRAGVITADAPADMWRELCWRYVVFPARAYGRDAEAVFAVYLRPHRPMIHAALVDTETGTVLDWPAAPEWHGKRPVWRRAPRSARRTAGNRVPAPGLAAPALAGPRLVGPALAGTAALVGPALVAPGHASQGLAASSLTAYSTPGPSLSGVGAANSGGRSAIF